MTIRDAVGAPGQVMSAPDLRHGIAGLLATSSADPLDVRTGVLYAGVDEVVVGNTDAAPMSVSVLAHQWVASKGAVNGPYLGSNDGLVKATITAAPGAGTRVDLVYVMQQDAEALVSPDASNGAVPGVVPGTPAARYDLVPAGALVLAEVAVNAGATNTAGAGVTITPVHDWTATRGAPVPVRDVTERDALTPYLGMAVNRLDAGTVELWDGTRWLPLTGAGKPWAEAGGQVNLPNQANTNTSTFAVAFPAGRFTVPPLITFGAGSSRLSIGKANVTKDGFDLQSSNWSGAASTGAPVDWYAKQMTPTSAAG